MLATPLTSSEEVALRAARAYRVTEVQGQSHVLPPDLPSTLSPHTDGVHISCSNRQNRPSYNDAGLWSFEEALMTRRALRTWKRTFNVASIIHGTLVADGLTPFISVGSAPNETLLQAILNASPEAHVSTSQLMEYMRGNAVIFALSYRHQGGKGANITTDLWTQVTEICSAIAASGGFSHYSLWIDSVSAATGKRKKEREQERRKVQSKKEDDYVDWFTVGVAPYLQLPAVLVAGQTDRMTRMWLRMEEKLSVYGFCNVYVVKAGEKVVRLEPGFCNQLEPSVILRCFSQSVLRGEYNGLRTTFKEDYINLLEWAVKYHKESQDCRGLGRVFPSDAESVFGEEFPIERYCIVLRTAVRGIAWLHGLEKWAGMVEYFMMIGDTQALRDEAEKTRDGCGSSEIGLLTMRDGRVFAVWQIICEEAVAFLNRNRLKSQADSTGILFELEQWDGAGRKGCFVMKRSVLFGVPFSHIDYRTWDFTAVRGLEVIPEAVKWALKVGSTLVRSVEWIPEEDFASRLIVEECS